jgi:CheY-like chemotaxis protein
VVDDDPTIRDMMLDILESEGYTADVARNGQEALNLLQGPTRYLVFLDLLMPVVNGKDVCHFLASQPYLQHILVLMSALDQAEQTHQLDIDMLMPKPFVVEDVVEALETYL